jgi:hypothetical protein
MIQQNALFSLNLGLYLFRAGLLLIIRRFNSVSTAVGIFMLKNNGIFKNDRCLRSKSLKRRKNLHPIAAYRQAQPYAPAELQLTQYVMSHLTADQ